MPRESELLAMQLTGERILTFPDRVLLAGNPNYAPLYHTILQRMGVDILGVIADDKPPDVKAPLLSVEQYVDTADPQKTPLVVLDHPLPDKTMFFPAFVERLTRLTDALPPILHASILGAFLPTPCHGKWTISGYPGSGNVLLYSLLLQISSTDIFLPEDKIQDLLLWLGADHYETMKHYLAGILNGLTIVKENMAPSMSPIVVQLRAETSGGHYLFIDNLPTSHFLGMCLFGHNLITPAVNDLLRHCGYKTFLNVRHPIDTIASNAAKTFRPLEHALYDATWFRHVSRQLAVYLSLELDHRDEYITIRYEDLLADPLATLRRLRDALGKTLSDAQLGDIWDRTGFQPLTPAGGEHLFQPGKSKLGYFTKPLLRIMESLELADLARAFGYEWPDADALPHERPLPGKPPKAMSPVYGRADYRRCHRFEHDRLPITVVSTDPGAIDIVRRNLDCPRLAIFLDSLGGFFGEPLRDARFDLSC